MSNPKSKLGTTEFSSVATTKALRLGGVGGQGFKPYLSSFATNVAGHFKWLPDECTTHSSGPVGGSDPSGFFLGLFRSSPPIV